VGGCPPSRKQLGKGEKRGAFVAATLFWQLSDKTGLHLKGKKGKGRMKVTKKEKKIIGKETYLSMDNGHNGPLRQASLEGPTK